MPFKDVPFLTLPDSARGLTVLSTEAIRIGPDTDVAIGQGAFSCSVSNNGRHSVYYTPSNLPDGELPISLGEYNDLADLTPELELLIKFSRLNRLGFHPHYQHSLEGSLARPPSWTKYQALFDGVLRVSSSLASSISSVVVGVHPLLSLHPHPRHHRIPLGLSLIHI